jgi:hypothetical protein
MLFLLSADVVVVDSPAGFEPVENQKTTNSA